MKPIIFQAILVAYLENFQLIKCSIVKRKLLKIKVYLLVYTVKYFIIVFLVALASNMD